MVWKSNWGELRLTKARSASSLELEPKSRRLEKNAWGNRRFDSVSYSNTTKHAALQEKPLSSFLRLPIFIHTSTREAIIRKTGYAFA